MKELRDLRIGEHALEIGSVINIGRKLHGVADAIACRQLDEAQAIAHRIEAERLAVHRDKRAEVDAARQITFVKLDLHAFHSPFASLRRNDTASSTKA